MICASIRFPIIMVDPDLVELAKEVPAIIEQSRKGVIRGFSRKYQVHNHFSIQLHKELSDAELRSKHQSILQGSELSCYTGCKPDMPHVALYPTPMMITYKSTPTCLARISKRSTISIQFKPSHWGSVPAHLNSNLSLNFLAFAHTVEILSRSLNAKVI